MHEALLALLASHPPADAQEAADLERMRVAARSLAAPLSRSQPEAHFTASAVVVSPDGARVALIHHGKLHRWLQPGGHVEESDGGELAEAALREAREETGLAVHLHPQAPRPLDVDAHVIPARREDAAHTHLDVRFLLIAADPAALQHDTAESHAAQWFGWDEALAKADEPALSRMLHKARALCERR
jgi:8-oxo-dGTP pyrophosphatase MutT (NUDIX family)